MANQPSNQEILDRLGDLDVAADREEMNAERLDDAYGPGGGDGARERAANLRAQFEALAAAHGVDVGYGEEVSRG